MASARVGASITSWAEKAKEVFKDKSLLDEIDKALNDYIGDLVKNTGAAIDKVLGFEYGDRDEGRGRGR